MSKKYEVDPLKMTKVINIQAPLAMIDALEKLARKRFCSRAIVIREALLIGLKEMGVDLIAEIEAAEKAEEAEE